MMVCFSFTDDEIAFLTKKVQQETLDFGQPPPYKRARTEESLPGDKIIFLSKFLSTPHSKTKNLLIEVKIF